MKRGIIFFGTALAIVIALHFAGELTRKPSATIESQSVMQANAMNFEDEVLKSKVPVLVDFWAPWCGPCRHMSPIVDQFSEDYKSQIKVAKVNVDENKILSMKYNIQGIPALCFFRSGKLVEKIEGAVPKEELVATMERVQRMRD